MWELLFIMMNELREKMIDKASNTGTTQTTQTTMKVFQ